MSIPSPSSSTHSLFDEPARGGDGALGVAGCGASALVADSQPGRADGDHSDPSDHHARGGRRCDDADDAADAKEGPNDADSTDDWLFCDSDADEHGDGAYEQLPAAPGDDHDVVVASREPPPIPGFYVFPGLLPREVATSTLREVAEADHFVGGARDQVMLFTAPPPAPSSLPPHIQRLDRALAELLADRLPPAVHAGAFRQQRARQAILNLYPPGTGITPHVDLPTRYADGIVGASLVGGCVMTLTREASTGDAPGDRFDVYLPPRSVYVLSGEARWEWAHGIAARGHDVVRDAGETMTLPRDVRASVTLRWMQDGAELLA